jgi:hypothetical protein
VTTDEIWPRDEAHRFRLYALRDGELRVVAAAPSLEGVGAALAGTLGEGDLEPLDRVGVLDTTGPWLVNPFA